MLAVLIDVEDLPKCRQHLLVAAQLKKVMAEGKFGAFVHLAFPLPDGLIYPATAVNSDLMSESAFSGFQC